ncbi:preprotein translocase subunit YajC [Altererythrobacter aquiaggeris]|uniref:preprotein translocase subunit YajC n=1 Tax=Aestuarierythrobacter aquiaggeris TaxID=1898396 RepID=UPI00301687D5
MKFSTFSAAGALLALALSAPLAAQDRAYGDQDARETRGSGRTSVEPYIEVSQIVFAELEPGDDVVTYTQLAAGVDASIVGRNNGGSVSVRYERNIAWDDDRVDSDTVTGIARGYASIIPQALTVEAGALAARSRVDGNGSATLSPLGESDTVSQVYSVYAGPQLSGQMGDVKGTANYRIGYTRVESPDAIILAPGAAPVDVFDESVTHSANANLQVAPGDMLPVGVGFGTGIYQEDIANLDQRVRDGYIRADVTVPVSPTLAVVAGVGYEDVEVSSRDALRDATGAAIVDSSGRFVTDDSAPRRIAFQTDGLIWDAGVVWRPSRRTSAEFRIGERYGSTTYYGNFAWAPSERSNVNVSVYDNVTALGGQVTNALSALPTEFTAGRNPLTGDITNCVAATGGSNCLNGALASVRSSTFRARGIAASYSTLIGRLSAGVGAGYDRRKFIAAQDTVLGAANGLTDENYYLAGYLSGQSGRRASWTANVYANWFDSGFDLAGDSFTVGTTAAYTRSLGSSFTANAALGLDHITSDSLLDDITTASARIGLRYGF